MKENETWSDFMNRAKKNGLSPTTQESIDKNESLIKSVETDLNKRWENGIAHHPKSEKLVKIIAKLDMKYGNDFFCFKIGGDGDNGEHLMYLLDIYFERRKEFKNEKITY